VGERSLYRLTIPEIARLYVGWKSRNEQAEDESLEQVDGRAAAQARARRSNPHAGKRRRVRESDRRVAEQFAD